jgi:hypothetical protein
MKEQVIYSLEEFTDKDYSRLIRLTESSYPGREISDQRYLEWEYEQNPAGKALINVALEGEKCVAQYLVIPRDFQVDGEIVKASLSVNTLTHPMHRGNSLFPKLAELNYLLCVQKKCLFTLGVPNANSYPVFVDKLSFQALGRVPFLLKTFQPQSVLWNLFTKKRTKKGTDIELDLSTIPASSDSGVSFFDPDADSGLYLPFLNKFLDTKKVAVHRSPEYLRWRYKSIPIRKYFMLKYVESGEMKAMAVVRAREIYGLKCLILMDFVSQDEQAAERMLNQHFEISRGNELQLIICAMQSQAPEFQFLKKAGFYKVPEKFLPQQLDLILRIHTDSVHSAKVRDFKSWFFTFGDYDIF